MNKKMMIVNGTMLFCITSFFTTTIHELGHFSIANLFHAQSPILYHNAVQYDPSAIALSSQIIIAAAGPLLSLLLGILFHFVCRKYSKRNFFFYFSVLMSAFCYVNFFGYLCLAPLFPYGDTGFVMRRLGFPTWLTISIAFGGGIPGYILIKNGIRPFLLELASAEILQDNQKRKAFIENIFTYPLLFGVAITTLLTFPVVSFLSVLYPLCSPFALFWGYNKFLYSPTEVSMVNPNVTKLSKLSWIVVFVFMLTVLCNRLLVYGFHF